MQLVGLGKYKNIKDLVLSKINLFKENSTEFSTLFNLMFSESENVMYETLEGYKIKEFTYGEVKEEIIKLASSIEELFKDYPKGSKVGLSMDNSIDWIESFWAILLAGYNPLLFNTRLSNPILEDVIKRHNVVAVISDGKTYNNCPTIIKSSVVMAKEIRSVQSFTFGREVIFMSSGTQGAIKLCSYTSECLYHQISDTYYIIKDCPQIRKGYEGKIKQLALLPFYHVFGFMAVYLWFGFFSRTFVFLKEMSPQTLLNTVRRHKVTHIFAVPLVWETIYKTAMKTIKNKGEDLYSKYQKGLKIAESGKLGQLLTHKAFSEIREQIFGDSIKFLVSGGSVIDKEAVRFFNAIGYHIANGYGMTEVGITSVELSKSLKERNLLSIGRPFKQVSYSCVDKELLVKSSSRASTIIYDDRIEESDFDEWFKTGDLLTQKDGKYYISGRMDDLIISLTGENLNPNIIETIFKDEYIEGVCLFKPSDDLTTLILSIKKCYKEETLEGLKNKVQNIIKEHNLENEIRRIVFTYEPLMGENDFKISRKKVLKKYEANEFKLIDLNNSIKVANNEIHLDLQELFSSVLNKDISEIGINDHFFQTLGGTSLDYFYLIDLINQKFSVNLTIDMADSLIDIQSIEEYIVRENI